MKVMKISLVLAGIFAVAFCGGCAQKTTQPKEIQSPEKCKDIMEELLEGADSISTDTKLFYGEEKYEEFFEYLYETSYDRVSDGAYAYASEAVADELTIIHANEEKDVKVIRGHLEERVERRMSDFMGYKPDEVEKLENAIIFVEGQYILMVVCDDPEEIVDKFKEIDK